MLFNLPPLGDGVDSATVTEVFVKPGDAIQAGQALIEVETDKANMPVEATDAGTVEEVLVQPGAKLRIGEPVLKLKAGSGSSVNGKAEAAPPSATPVESVKEAPADAPNTQAASLPSASSVFTLPPLGDGVESATIISVLVKPGDAVKNGQPVLEVETDKANMPVECTEEGVVEEVLVQEGTKVSIGAPVFTLKVSAGKATAPTATSPAAASAKPVPTPIASSAAAPRLATGVTPPPSNGAASSKVLVAASPSTRRLARELGVNLAEVSGTARGGRVTLDDVKGFVKSRLTSGAGTGQPISGSIVDAFTLPPLPDFSKYGEIETKPVAKIRETIARNLTIGWRTMPMVTQNDLADITDLEAGRKRIIENLPKGAPKITMTVLAIKAVVAALKEFPQYNASYDMNKSELVLKKYFHIGIAVDTERGLVVPVIRDADKKSIRDLAVELNTLAEKARTGKLSIDEMRGGCFTITNLGGIGGTSFTPIVNYPEVAILGLSRSALQPVVRDGQIVPRLMMPMSLTYDHRVIDGADGARFTTRLAQLFSDPIRLLMES